MARRQLKKDDRLAEYRRKRSAEGTPEPFTGPASDSPRLFVVQKHAATRMHYDLRLEFDGVLHSWAVPKGPSLDPSVKRLAVEVEQHPLEYGDFEGIIPAGNYGAGAVIVWDRGQWVPIEDPVEGLKKGKLLFDLRGYKLRGRWTLFRTSKGEPKDWLLMKKPDGEARDDHEFKEESIRCGLTVEELRDGVDPTRKIRKRLARLKAPRADVDVMKLDLMLAQPHEKPFTRKGWLFELKYDGFRLLAAREGKRARLRYRRGQDTTTTFPELAVAMAALPYDSLILDGEVVVLDDEGRPTFHGLQQRVHLTRRADIQRATVEQPVTLFVFDLLAFDGFDLRSLPLVERKKLLDALLPAAGPLRYCDHIPEQGEAMYEQVAAMGLEGIVAKRADAPYLGLRSPDWLKIRADRTDDFVVVGYSKAKGSRRGFGALHLAVHEPEGLVYAGRVGSGFDAALLKSMYAELEPTRREASSCSGTLPTGDAHTWVDPLKVVEVRYKEWRDGGLLRHPVFLRERDDKPPEDCVRTDARTVDRRPAPPPAEAPAERIVSFTNLTKLFWPEEGYTKGDLIEYYRSISSWLLPYLEDRPIVLTRYPDGVDGKNFFQKDAPGFVPDWVRTETMWSEHAQREIHYFICDDEETLLYLINLGSIPLHLWSSRVATLQQPDWCILDLDPKLAPFKHVVTVARAIHKLCEEIGLESFVKTSGSTGIHVLLPLGRQCTYEQSRSLGQLMARIVAADNPDIATVARAHSRRGERVYIDYVQNGHGRLLVSPFCVRPLPAAPVSTPLRWSEVNKRLDIRKHNIRSVPARFKRMKQDPLIDVLETVPDLPEVLQRLADRLDRTSSGGKS